MNDPDPYRNVIAAHQQELLRAAATARLARQAGRRGSSWALWKRATLRSLTARRVGQLIHETTEETRQLRLVEVKRAQAAGAVPDADDKDTVIRAPRNPQRPLAVTGIQERLTPLREGSDGVRHPSSVFAADGTRKTPLEVTTAVAFRGSQVI
jgi:hypothetical protein